ncbi:MAG: hypothetical protein OJF47_001997 [Nitrospira sp.]|jgi:hypothetical protein|nr:MAG: hypothetical protein OJF47_001997 [Nitrospira sp.]
MTKTHGRRWCFCLTALIVVTEMSACALVGALPFGGDSWQEEVLLHEGSTIVVERTVERGGRHEVGQPPPIKEQTITFTLPESKTRMTWTSEYGEDIGRTNFLLLAVHVLNGTPYLVTEPNLCLAYNKWGRPNPPYVVFKYDGTAWQRIPLADLPVEFTTLNVVISLDSGIVQKMVKRGLVPVEEIRKLNRALPQPEFKTLLREPVKIGSEGTAVNCPEMVFYKGAWVGPGDSIGKRMRDRESK